MADQRATPAEIMGARSDIIAVLGAFDDPRDAVMVLYLAFFAHLKVQEDPEKAKTMIRDSADTLIKFVDELDPKDG